VRLSSSNSRLGALALALLLAGCVGSAPDLPPDTTSLNHTTTLTLADFSESDAALSCAAITAERQKIDASMADANGRIEANRGRDQGVMFAGTMLGVVGTAAAAPFVANTNDSDRSEIAKLYQRRDTLLKLAEVKRCPSS
jgi:hypothetical protein